MSWKGGKSWESTPEEMKHVDDGLVKADAII
jgi:hypothetical protein